MRSLVLLCLFAFATVDATAQQPPAASLSAGQPSAAASYVGKQISAAVLMSEGELLTDAMMLGLIESRVGTPLSMAAVRETIAHLYSLGRFQEVTVEAAAAGDGVGLTYHLVPVHSVERIEFTGNLGLSQGQLRRAVVDRFSATPSAARAANVAEMLQNFYFDRGYLAAAIRPLVEVKHDPDSTTLTFEIESGPRASVGNVIVEGDPLQPREQFLDRIHATPGQTYQRIDVQERLTEYLDQMRRLGRYEAQGSHRILAQSDDGRSVDLLVTVDPGAAMTIRFEGDPLPKARLEELVPIREEGAADADIIEDSERRIASYLQQQGYWKAQATAARRETAGNVEIVFTIRRGLQYRIGGDVALSGNASVPVEDLRPALQNLESGDIFIMANLDASLSAIRGIYLRRGFAQVKVESAVKEANPTPEGEGRVTPVIVITEGPLLTIGALTFSGNADLSSEELAARLGSRRGSPYFEPQVIQDREMVLAEYLNQGFAGASVDVVPTVDGSTVNIEFKITEGPQSIVDHVLIVGNVKTDVRVIEREIQLQEGQPLGLEAMFETRRRLGALGLFRRVRIEEIPHGESNRRDVLITVEEAPSTTIGYGGGLELTEILAEDPTGAAVGSFELAPRGFFEIGRRNIRGKNRSVNLYTRLSLRSDFDDGEGGQFGFAEYRVLGTFREPLTFGWNADVTITAAVEQGARSTFNFARRGINSEILRRLSPEIRVSARYTFSNTRIFDQRLTDEGDQATIDRVFPQVSLSAVSSAVARDTRDDVLEPTNGTFMSAEGTVASRFLGGQVGFLKSYVQAQGYRRLSSSRRLVLAGRVALGLANGLPREVTTVVAGTPITQTIEDLPASERFFAGGDTTVRGFALDSLGTAKTLTPNGFPTGGNGLVLMNAELRFPMWRDLEGAVFTDVGNVFERASQIEVSELRTTAGVGLRYRSPFGPLRIDVGFKLDRRPYGDNDRQAFHFSFGHAF